MRTICDYIAGMTDQNAYDIDKSEEIHHN
ncbi:MAG: hypothetical protein ACYDEJ_14125 [Desulfitobacteriaceae bacterium]